MSYKSQASMRKHPKVQFEEYLCNLGEPKDANRRHIPSEVEAELIVNNLDTKQQFRQLAKMNRKPS